MYSSLHTFCVVLQIKMKAFYIYFFIGTTIHFDDRQKLKDCLFYKQKRKTEQYGFPIESDHEWTEAAQRNPILLAEVSCERKRGRQELDWKGKQQTEYLGPETYRSVGTARCTPIAIAIGAMAHERSSLLHFVRTLSRALGID